MSRDIDEDHDKVPDIYEVANWLIDHDGDFSDDASLDALRRRGMADKSLSPTARYCLSMDTPLNWLGIGSMHARIIAARGAKGRRF